VSDKSDPLDAAAKAVGDRSYEGTALDTTPPDWWEHSIQMSRAAWRDSAETALHAFAFAAMGDVTNINQQHRPNPRTPRSLQYRDME